ncbi:MULTISPECIES: hypothetical protein [unclassified Streptomyces]|uniref:hypothetical protein n=1 Tax=unclassified Streptomyces TaxID=2593676 RepID=UPI002DD8BA3D|nr:hypothetical protein [Streptomyces sp. NBC_01795]WSA97738.1 hypothetical protein OIE63_40335 [Streptomyces sp. NBC_01795]WSS46745.1 hypothetical protein OG220_39885 [Streptomyces sp. NBC_01187]WSS47038.1 hypothetical protein OG220_41740 [Streptomyces sp. NBC_01187]
MSRRMPPVREQGWREWGDRGGIPVFVAVMTASLLALMGVLIVDGGSTMRAAANADALAREAARAGGQAVDEGDAVEGRGLRVKPPAARAAAQEYLRSAGKSGSVTVSEDGKHIHIRVRDTYQFRFLPGSRTVTGEGDATLLHGVTEPEN